MSRAAIALVAWAVVAFGQGTAGAHGGLPVSVRVLRAGASDTLYVPVVFWGVWVGGEGQKWKWICEEAINTNRFRRLALSVDGTFYATDFRGLSQSTDGCTWRDATGEISGKKVTDVAADSVDGATAYATTADSGQPDADGGTGPASNALYVTHDRGAAWTRVSGLAGEAARRFHAVRVAPSDPKVLYVASTLPSAGLEPSLHRSADNGVSFTRHPISVVVDGVVPHELDLLAIDPRDPRVVYVRLFAQVGAISRQVLVRSSDGGASFAEIARVDGVGSPSGFTRGIDGVAIDVQRGRVFVATSAGLLAGDDAGGAPSVTLQPTGNLSQAQCVDVRGGTVFACSNNFSPDFAALARSDDGAQSFQSILNYVDTVGPVECPAGTTVGDLCPAIWEMYGSQLGIDFTDGGASDGGGPPPPKPSCGCAVGGGSAGVLGALVLLAFLALALRRRA